MTLIEIQEKTRAYAKCRARLADVARDLDAEIKVAQRRYMLVIAKRIADTKDAHAQLVTALEAGKTLFDKPRTQTFDGVKVGFKKGKGKITIADDARTVALIYKHLPDQAGLLIRTVETPAKDAIDNLAVADLKRIGCSIQDATDSVVITPAASDVDKMINAMLKESTEDE